MKIATWIAGSICAMVVVVATGCSSSHRSLHDWNDVRSRHEITSFVERVTNRASSDYVPPEERIAVFDNDGTLWAEQPLYFQLFFALDRIKAMAPQHPEWKTTEPFASVLRGDVKAALAGGEKAILEIVSASHSGMTSEEFDALVRDWIATARHPETGQLYTEMVYQPMVEVLAYLRAHGFKTYIVSGGGVEFMRGFAERVYGIPPEQVIGSMGKLRYELHGEEAVLIKEPGIFFIDDKTGKPEAIHREIGRRPIAAFGNSDGDQQMLEWTDTGGGPSLCVLIHHTDAAREWAYDHPSSIGQLDTALVEARARGWTVVSMKTDWRKIFAHPIRK